MHQRCTGDINDERRAPRHRLEIHQLPAKPRHLQTPSLAFEKGDHVRGHAESSQSGLELHSQPAWLGARGSSTAEMFRPLPNVTALNRACVEYRQLSCLTLALDSILAPHSSLDYLLLLSCSSVIQIVSQNNTTPIQLP